MLERLKSRGIDSGGLDRMDRRIVQVLLERGRPTGLRTLADQLGEERRTIAEIHEPYLLRRGLIARTYRGRVATERARGLFTLGRPGPEKGPPMEGAKKP